jgi:hypothetical protein
MKRFLAAVAMAVALTPSKAFAQERVADAALGGLSGAIVFGPVGAVAGIIVGFAAGPGISRSWGLSRPCCTDYRYQARIAPRSAVARASNAELRQASAQNASNAELRQATAPNASAASPKPASETNRSWESPPVVGFE